MAEQRHLDTRTDGQETTGRAVKRRGILAAAAAVVAGLAAKQTSQSVAAAGNLVLETTANNEAAGTGMVYTGGAFTATSAFAVGDEPASFSVPQGAMSAGVSTRGTAPIGVWGSTTVDGGTGVYGRNDSSGGKGVLGRCDGMGGYGVYGSGNFGVVGNTNAPTGSGAADVFGYANGSGTYGVIGDGAVSGSTGTGAVGVQGKNAQYGVVGTVNNADNTIAVYGNNTSSGSGGIGVDGYSLKGTGVVGKSDGASGIIGSSTANGAYGVFGSVSGSGAVALGSQATGPGALAGFFTGPTRTDGQAQVNAPAAQHAVVGTGGSASGGTKYAGVMGKGDGGAGGGIGVYGQANANGLAGYLEGKVCVAGDLVVLGSYPKNAAVAHPDGTHRLLYHEESTESWFADYGRGTLVNGTAAVKLDGDFAALVHGDDYHVFLTSHDAANKGLAVTAHRPDGFVVQEQGGGTSGGTFSYRVVAKRKDIKGERLAKVTPPGAMAPPLPLTVPPPPAIPEAKAPVVGKKP